MGLNKNLWIDKSIFHFQIIVRDLNSHVLLISLNWFSALRVFTLKFYEKFSRVSPNNLAFKKLTTY